VLALHNVISRVALAFLAEEWGPDAPDHVLSTRYDRSDAHLSRRRSCSSPSSFATVATCRANPTQYSTSSGFELPSRLTNHNVICTRLYYP
jgi:hypothetical protein